VVQNDIAEEFGAITNPANSKLDHGGGVAEAISRKGGYIINE
jgi:O-acetyl-ADP-ribose deacetylase (regulator of RNase III)